MIKLRPPLPSSALYRDIEFILPLAKPDEPTLEEAALIATALSYSLVPGDFPVAVIPQIPSFWASIPSKRIMHRGTK